VAKYDPLRDHLHRGTEPVAMSFDTIAELVGGLPASASRHRAWWANDASHVHAHAWLDVGRSVQSVDLTSRQVCFSARAAP
jgi:hypothetical protein